MKIVYVKDKNRRIKFNALEKNKLVLKYIFNNIKLSSQIRDAAYLEYQILGQDTAITKIKNRCILTNRAKGIYSKFKISRIFFKKFALEGNLPGVKKASW